MKRIKICSAKLGEWIEFGWLLVSNPSFQASRDKRLAYYDYRLSKTYNTPCY